MTWFFIDWNCSPSMVIVRHFNKCMDEMDRWMILMEKT